MCHFGRLRPPDIHSVQDLKGHKIGINRQGDLDDRLSHAVLQHENIPADSVQFIPAGGQPERYKAVLGGVIDAVTVTPPLEVQARIDDMPMAAVQDSIEFARSQGTSIARGQAEQLVDQRFAVDLQTSGFLERMWGRPVPGSR